EVKRLRVVLLRKGDNVFLVNTHAAVRLEHLSDCEILEIPFRHQSIPPASDGGEYNGRPWGHTWGNSKGLPFLFRRAAAIIRGILVEHDLFGKPVPTFPDHARTRRRMTKGWIAFLTAFVLATSVTPSLAYDWLRRPHSYEWRDVHRAISELNKRIAFLEAN